MPRIQLVVTGDMELRALRRSLWRYFGETARFLQPMKQNCATTSRLRDPSDTGARIPDPMQRLAKAALRALTHKIDREGPADFVFVIDDIELANRDQPEVVTAWFCRAMRAAIDAQVTTEMHRERTRKMAREQCGFHLLVPMTESYFFGDPSAMQRTGVASDTRVYRVAGDVECFETSDPAFLAKIDEENQRLFEKGRPPCEWQHHPKKYLNFLCVQSGKKGYDESLYGAEALARLDWKCVANCPEHVRFARSMFEDIADALGVPNPIGVANPGNHEENGCHPATCPGRRVRREMLTLRNC